MKKIILLLSLLASSHIVLAQSSVLQDGDGETSFQTTKNLIAINAANSAISFSITPFTSRHWDYNFTGSFEAKEGTTKLFSSGKLQFNGKTGFQFVHRRGITSRHDMTKTAAHFFGGVEILYSKINVYDSTLVFKDQIFNQNNIGFRVNVGKVHFKAFWGFTLAASAAAGIHDNSENLEQSEIITSTAMQINGMQTRIHAVTEDVYVNHQIERSNIFGKINADIGHHFLDNRLYGNLHFLYQAEKGIKPTANAAIGLFVIQKNAPMEAVAGIQIQSNDLFDTAGTGGSLDKRTSLVLTVGFPFN